MYNRVLFILLKTSSVRIVAAKHSWLAAARRSIIKFLGTEKMILFMTDYICHSLLHSDHFLRNKRFLESAFTAECFRFEI